MSMITGLMDAIPAAATGGASLGLGAIADVGSAVGNFLSGQSTNQQMQQMQVQQEQFQETMSDTAHTREVADLKNAGLNPILSATGGSGASTPSGSLPSLQAPPVHLPDMMAYGIQMKQLEQADAKIGIDQANSASNIAKNLTDNQLTRMQTVLSQKGLIPAQLEGEGAQLLQKMVKPMIDSVVKPNINSLHSPFSSGGELAPESNSNVDPSPTWNQEPFVP